MIWTIEFAESVKKDMRKLDSITRKRIRNFLEARLSTVEDPRSMGKALAGPLSGLWRYRLGDYRIIAKIENNTTKILILRIADRKDVYR